MTTIRDSFRLWMEQNQLLYLSLIKPKNGKQVLWGRIIKYEEDQNLIILYHDDEKKTYQVMLNEIEDVKPANKNITQNVKQFNAEQINIMNKNIVYEKKHKKLLHEAQELINKLSMEELMAILPLLQHFYKTKK